MLKHAINNLRSNTKNALDTMKKVGVSNASDFGFHINKAKNEAVKSGGIQSVTKNQSGAQFNYKDKTGYFVEKPKTR